MMPTFLIQLAPVQVLGIATTFDATGEDKVDNSQI